MAGVRIGWREEDTAFIDTEHPGRPGGSDGRGDGGGGSWLAAIGFVGLPLLAGVVGNGASAGALDGWYPSLARPPGVPPDWVFGVVWTLLYVLMGLSAWMVWRAGRQVAAAAATATGTMPGTITGAPLAARALRLWGWQLLVNAAWGPVFFGLHSVVGGLVLVASLVGLVSLTLAAFARVRVRAAALLVPYLAWVCYASYLNIGFWWLNRV